MAKCKENKSAKTNIGTDTSKERCGRVVRNTGSSYGVRLDDGTELNCRVKGNFRIKGIRTTNPVAVGDIVKVRPSAEDAEYIVGIEQRKNYIIRRASNLSKESHILAANIDQSLLIVSLRNPETPLPFIDRFLATSEAYDVPAILVLNKKDTWDAEELEYAEAIKNLYDGIGYKVFMVSAKTGEGVEQLRRELIEKITLLAGNSGVGKTSLINYLVPGADLRTGAVSELHHTGRHTTTFSEMIPLPGGGDLIDIPGVKGFGVIDFKVSEVSHYFPEIFNESKKCKYSNCLHLDEPGCAVRQAVENHFISESRYSSYLGVVEDAKEENKYRKPF